VTTYNHKTAKTVTLGGADISDTVLALDGGLGFGQRVSAAKVEVSTEPVGWSYWDPLVIATGYQGSNVATRFDGYLVDISYRNWPQSVTLVGEGRLGIAKRLLCPEDEALAEHDRVMEYLSTYGDFLVGTAGDPYSGDPFQEPPAGGTLDGSGSAYAAIYGTDPSVRAEGIDFAGMTDVEIITAVLTTYCGLGARLGTIGGLGRDLGTINPDGFVWKRGQSALAFIESIDAMSLGFRTFETLGGVIVRRFVSPRNPWTSSLSSLTRGVDILEGAGASRTIKDAKNRIIVEGWNDGVWKRVWQVLGAHPAPPPGITVDTFKISNPMIELQGDLNPTAGVSCREVAEYLFGERGHVIIEAQIPTWRDDSYAPGYAVSVTDPTLGLAQSVWVRDVAYGLNEQGEFTQKLTVRARLDVAVAPTLSMTLPASLKVNP
jgi:hypothetical protein